MAPTLEDLLALPPDQITPQHVHMLGLAPDPIVPPAAPAAPPIAKMTPPAAAAPEPALPKMTPPGDAPGMTLHYHEAPEPKPKEPKAEKPEENPTGFRAGTAEGAERPPEPTTKSELPAKLTPPAMPAAPAAAPLSLQPAPPAAPAALPPLKPPVVPEALRQPAASALPSAVMPAAPAAPTGIDTSLLNAPKRSLESFKSREAEPRNLSLNTTAGGPPILDRPGTSGEQADILARMHDEAAHPWGGPENHQGALGKLAHVAARIGNIAGNIVAPATMANIPGTDLNKRRLENEAQTRLGEAQTRETATAREASEEPLRAAQTLEAQARAYGALHPQLAGKTAEEIALAARQRMLAGTGTPDDEAMWKAYSDVKQAAQDVKPDTEKWSVAPGVVGPHGEPVQQSTTGEMRVAPLEGATLNERAKEDDFEQYYDKYRKDNNLPDTAHSREVARARYAAAGELPQRPPQQLLMVPQPDGSQKVMVARPGMAIPKGATTLSAENQEKMFQERQAAPTTQMRNVAAQSQIAVDAAPNLLAELDRMRDQLGPVSGQWNAFMQGKLGADKPEFAGLRADLLLYSSAVALAHARGRLPENLREEFDAAINAPKQNADNLIAIIQHIQPYMERSAHIGGVGQPAAGGGGGAGGLANPEENATRTNKKTGEVQTFIEGKWQTTKPAARQ